MAKTPANLSAWLRCTGTVHAHITFLTLSRKATPDSHLGLAEAGRRSHCGIVQHCQQRTGDPQAVGVLIRLRLSQVRTHGMILVVCFAIN
jgi:hypothetical protein